MALINCPECSREISDKVKTCPHCGFPFEGAPSRSNSAGSLRLIVAACPRCGADLEFDAGHEHYFCSFCGSEVIIENKSADNENNSSINTEKFYNAAVEALSADNINEAMAGLAKILDHDPDHYNAIMLKGICLALGTPLHLINANEVISYFKLSQDKFNQTKPSEELKLKVYESYAANLLYTCTRIFDAAQITYVEGGVSRAPAEYQFYWMALIADTNLALFALELFRGSPMLLNDSIAGIFKKTCDLVDTICDEVCRTRNARGVGPVWMQDRKNFASHKDAVQRMRDDQRDMQERQREKERREEQQKHWDEHPDEYKAYQEKREALIKERNEQYSIIEANKKKLIGEGAKTRKAAEARLEEILNLLKKFD